MLESVAIGLVLRQERDHDPFDPTPLAAAPTHARAHANAQTGASHAASQHPGRSQVAASLKRAPDAATVEDVRNFQLPLVDTGSFPLTLNATLTGLKFFFDIELMAKMQPVKLTRTLPVVLSGEEVSRLLAAARNIKHQVALSVAYGAGLLSSDNINRSRFFRALGPNESAASLCRSTAFRYQAMALTPSCATPQPRSYISPRFI